MFLAQQMQRQGVINYEKYYGRVKGTRTIVAVVCVCIPASHRGGPGSNPGLVIWNFVMDKIGAGAGFIRRLLFPLPIYILSASPQSSSLSPEAATIGQEWPQCQ
jgi:hypothetical protein